VNHMFKFWPVDGQVTFDPEGILSTYPACFNVLFGVLVGLAYRDGKWRRPIVGALTVGGGMMLLAVALHSVCPVIKNLWTSTFAVFSSGSSLFVLGTLMAVSQKNIARQILYPARVFGENPLLAYVLCWLLGPLLDIAWIGDHEVPISLRNAGQLWFGEWMNPQAASLLFGFCCLTLLFIVLLVCHRKRWILKI